MARIQGVKFRYDSRQKKERQEEEEEEEEDVSRDNSKGNIAVEPGRLADPRAAEAGHQRGDREEGKSTTRKRRNDNCFHS